MAQQLLGVGEFVAKYIGGAPLGMGRISSKIWRLHRGAGRACLFTRGIVGVAGRITGGGAVAVVRVERAVALRGALGFEHVLEVLPSATVGNEAVAVVFPRLLWRVL